MEAAETAKKEAVKARSVKKGNSVQKGKQRSGGSSRTREAKPARRGESQRARERHRESYRRDYDREYDRGTIKSSKSGKYLTDLTTDSTKNRKIEKIPPKKANCS